VDVTVVTPVGSSSLGLSDNLTYETAPTVSGVSPSSAFTDGSTALTITGTNFTGASQVTIGGQNLPSSSFTVNGSTTIYVNAPSSATTGLVDVTVTTRRVRVQPPARTR